MTWPFPAADSDARHIDAAFDDLATGDDIYSTTWEPQFGSAHVAVLAATQASDPLSAGSYPADALVLPTLSSRAARGLAGPSDL
jgi:hypothetical protein